MEMALGCASNVPIWLHPTVIPYGERRQCLDHIKTSGTIILTSTCIDVDRDGHVRVEIVKIELR